MSKKIVLRNILVFLGSKKFQITPLNKDKAKKYLGFKKNIQVTFKYNKGLEKSS